MHRQSDGLSPLARGTPNIIQGINNYRRFIPAGAGNTLLWLRYWKSLPVYPRWRGEHPAERVQVLPRLGLSPLARGTLIQVIPQLAHFRFIPAGAGNTNASPSL